MLVSNVVVGADAVWKVRLLLTKGSQGLVGWQRRNKPLRVRVCILVIGTLVAVCLMS